MLNLTDEAKRALKPVIAEFVQTGDVKAFDEFLKLSGDGTTTLNDAAVAANDFAASLQLVSNSWNQFANQQLAGPWPSWRMPSTAWNRMPCRTGWRLAEHRPGSRWSGGRQEGDAVRWTKGVWDAAKPSKGGAGGMGGAMADLGATPSMWSTCQAVVWGMEAVLIFQVAGRAGAPNPHTILAKITLWYIWVGGWPPSHMPLPWCLSSAPSLSAGPQIEPGCG